MVVTGCVVRDPIQMKETTLYLTKVDTVEYPNRTSLHLQWRTADGNIRIVTEAPLDDKGQYKVGSLYSRCFLPR